MRLVVRVYGVGLEITMTSMILIQICAFKLEQIPKVLHRGSTMYECMDACRSAGLQVCMQACMFACWDACMYTGIMSVSMLHTHTHTHTYTYIYIYMYMYVYIYIFIHTPVHHLRAFMCPKSLRPQRGFRSSGTPKPGLQKRMALCRTVASRNPKQKS